MKNRYFLFLSLGAMLFACHPKADTLIGTWTAGKVNVQFDEQRSTPELVKQVGEMEKRNIIIIDNDSTLTFKGLDEEWKGRISLQNDTLFRDGKAFGIWKDGAIVTRNGSPLGEVVVTYKKD